MLTHNHETITEFNRNLWFSWWSRNWSRLVAREKILIRGSLPHPEESGFEVQLFAEPVGQSKDWTISLSDGSRIHVQEFPDGRVVAHRDATDPRVGVKATIQHISDEGGPVAKIALIGAVIVGGAIAVKVLRMFFR